MLIKDSTRSLRGHYTVTTRSLHGHYAVTTRDCKIVRAAERESQVHLVQRREIHEHVCMLEAYMRQEPTCFRDASQACDISEH